MRAGHLSTAPERWMWRAAWVALVALLAASVVQPGLPSRAGLAARSSGPSWLLASLDALRLPYPFAAREPAAPPVAGPRPRPRVIEPAPAGFLPGAFLGEAPPPPVEPKGAGSDKPPPIEPVKGAGLDTPPPRPKVKLRYRIAGLYVAEAAHAPRVLIETPGGKAHMLVAGDRCERLRIERVERVAGGWVTIVLPDGKKVRRCAGQVVEILVDAPDERPTKGGDK